MAKYLNRDGVKQLRKNLKNEIPTKTSELENNSGFITENDLPSFSGYTKSEADTLLAGKSNTGHTHAGSDITDLATVATTGDYSDLTNKPVVDSALSSTSTNALQNKVINSELSKKANTSHTHSVSDVSGLATVATSGSYNDLTNKPTIPMVDSALSSTSTNALQNKVINTALNTKANTSHSHSASDITSGLASVATSGSYNDLTNKPTIPTVDSSLSSTSTNPVQNKVINSALGNKSNVGHTHTSGEVSGLATVATTGSYNDLLNKPSSITPSSHTHGSISNDGKIGTASGKPLITTTGGTITTGSFGTTAGTFCEGNDSRLSDARTPTSHTHTKSEITDFPTLATVATSGSYNDLSNKPSIPVVDSALSSSSTNALQNKVINSALNTKANTGHTHTVSDVSDFPTLATVATSGSYNDLSNKPTIPTVDSSLSSTSTNAIQNKVVNNALNGKSNTGHTHTGSDITDLATVATSGSYNDLTNKPTSMTPASHTHGSITNDGKLGTTSGKPLITTTGGSITTGSFGTSSGTFCEGNDSRLSDARTPTSHNHSASEITSGTLNSARIPNLDASKITSGTIDIARLPAGALERLVTVADQTARFALTTSSVQLGDTVKQLDTGIMYYVVDTSKLNSADGYTEYTAGSATSVPWSGVTGKPSSYTPASHTHGNITNAGAIGSTANKPLITTTNGVITTGSFGTTANTFCQGNDSRLSDSRTPKAHTHSASDITSGLATVATSGSYNDLSNKPSIPVVDSALSSTSTNALQNKVIYTELSGKSNTGHTHTGSDITDLATVATSGSYNDLSNKPTIPTVNNATLTIQKNGTTVKTFTANASSNVTANITVPTKTSDLTNDSHQTITVGTDTTSTASPAHSGTFTCVDSVTRDSNGHVTAINTKTVTLPADNNTDTKVTNTLGTTTKAYITGTTSATTNTGTQVFDTGVYLSTTAGELVATKFTGNLTGSVTPVATGIDLTDSTTTGTKEYWWQQTKDKNGSTVTCLGTVRAHSSGLNQSRLRAVNANNKWADLILEVKDDNTYGIYTSASSGVTSSGFHGNSDSATQFSANQTVALTGDVTGSASSKAGWSVATTLANSGVTAGTYGPSADVTGNNNATISVPQITVDAKGRVTSVTNRTLTCKNNTYNVYNKTLTIQKNGSNVATFTSNSNTDVTANITVPTKVSELTNDSGYLTSHQSLSNYVTLNTAQTITGDKTFEGALKINAYNWTIRYKTQGTSNYTNYDTFKQIEYNKFNNIIALRRSADVLNSGDNFNVVDTSFAFYKIHIRSKYIDLVDNARFINDGTNNYVLPLVDNSTTFGSSTNRWKEAYAYTFKGTLSNNGDAFAYTNANALYFYSGQPALTNCAEGSSNDFTKFSYPTGGTYTSSSNANIQTLRLVFGGTYWHDIFCSPNNNYLWHRDVVNGTGKGWRRIVEENVSGLTNQTWNINIGGSSASCTGNAATATNATNNANGKELSNSIIKGLSISGKTITYTQIDGSTGTLTTQDTVYTLPTASSTLGGVKTTSTVTSATGYTACPIIGGVPYYKDTNTTYTLSSLGIGNVKNYDQSKAINSITRSGTTFTYTCLDGTSGTFTQQDNNTWTALTGATSSANGTVGYINATPPKDGYNTKFFRADGTWAVPANTWTAMVGATSSANGSVGYVNAVPPKDGYNTKYLRADGTWAVPPDHTYTVNNATLTIQKNGTNVATFTSNASSNATANITVPTKVSELTNDSGYLTSHQSLANYVTLNGDQTISATKNWTKSQTFKNTALTNHKANPSADTELWACQFWSNDNKYWGGFGHKYLTTGVSEVQIAMSNWTTSGSQGYWYIAFGATKDFSSVYFRPSGNNNVYLGTSDKKWANVYATTFTGNLTGDVTGNVTGNCSGSSGSCTGNAATATQFSANKSVTLTGDVTGTASSKAGWSVATTLADSGVTAGTYGPSADVTGSNNATISVPEITVDSKGRVTSVVNRTYTSVNSTYNVYNKTLTIQKNGTNVATFTSNSNSNVTANITVPTKVSELTNDSGFLTSHQSLSNYVTLNSAQTITAEKTISSNLCFSTTHTRGTAPSSRETRFFARLLDSAGHEISALVNIHNTNMSNYVGLYAYNTTVATGNNIGNLGIGCDASGNVYTKAPTPATTDNSTQIATTAFVKAFADARTLTSIATRTSTSSGSWVISCKANSLVVISGSVSASTTNGSTVIFIGSGGHLVGNVRGNSMIWADNDNIGPSASAIILTSSTSLSITFAGSGFTSVNVTAYQL